MHNPKPNICVYFSVSIFISIPIFVSFLCSDKEAYFKMLFVYWGVFFLHMMIYFLQKNFDIYILLKVNK